MNKLYHNPNVHPRPEGSTINSPQPTTTRLTPEPILKAIWKKITLWFYDLTYHNALANTKETMFKELRKIGSK